MGSVVTNHATIITCSCYRGKDPEPRDCLHFSGNVLESRAGKVISTQAWVLQECLGGDLNLIPSLLLQPKLSVLRLEESCPWTLDWPRADTDH
jgi:hypothetical protein